MPTLQQNKLECFESWTPWLTLPFLENVRLALKILVGTNTLTYFVTPSVTKEEKRFCHTFA
jgi:hypothetical protein